MSWHGLYRDDIRFLPSLLSYKLAHIPMELNPSKRPFDNFQESNGTQELSEAASPKRLRADPGIAPSPTLWNMITTLPLATTHSLIFYACDQNPSLSATVQTSYNDLIAAEAAKPEVNFDSYSKSCWHTLNKKYARLSGSEQYNIIDEIMEALSESRSAILEQAGPHTRWETRCNALEVLRKIAKSVMLCEERLIRHELMKQPHELGAFAEAMVEIARGMTEGERERYMQEGLYVKLVDLQTSCDWENDMEGLRELYEIFDGPGDENDEGEEEGDEVEGDAEEDEEQDYEEIADDVEEVEGDIEDGSAAQPYSLASPDIPPQRSKVFSVSELA